MDSRYIHLACLLLALGCSDSTEGTPCSAEKPCPAGFLCKTTIGESVCVEAPSPWVTTSIPIDKLSDLPPYVMLVVDRSGSEGFPEAFDPMAESEWDEVSETLTAGGLNPVLTPYRDDLRLGLTIYPSGPACEPGTVVVPIDPDDDNVFDVTVAIGREHIIGGSPTALSLTAAGTDPHLAASDDAGRQRFVVLITYGRPNCNPSPANARHCDACNANPSSCGQNPGCQPTFGVSTTECNVDAAAKGSDCLDEQGTVDAVKALRASGIKTYVVGYGKTLESDVAERVLNRAAVAGGKPQSGPQLRYYKATDREQLRHAVSNILSRIWLDSRCIVPIGARPANSDVYVALYDVDSKEEKPLLRNYEWRFATADSFDELLLDWETCNKIRDAAPNSFELRVTYLPET